MRKLLIGFCILTLAALACNLNAKLTPASQSQSAIATVVAQTMRAVVTASNTPAAVLNTPTLIALSPSPTPMAVVKAIATCRSGPGENYKDVTDLTPNQNAAVLGKDPTGQYWLIQISSGTCWVGAQYVTVSGDIKNVPELTPPPSTSQDVPATPGSLSFSYSCPSLTEATITLTWKDTANDESGYHVYRNGVLIAELPANSTTYTDNTSRSSGSIFSYSVDAFNSIGASKPTTQSFRLSGCANP